MDAADVEVEMAGRSRLVQYRALMIKHVRSYKRCARV